MLRFNSVWQFFGTGFAIIAGLGAASMASADAAAVNATITTLTTQIFEGALTLAVSLAAIVIAGGGIYYIISFGRGKVTDEAIAWIKSGFTGLMIVMLAWLVLYTINPDIFVFNWTDLPKIVLEVTGGGAGGQNGNPNVITYNEIPLGKVTENLLTGKMNCYDFDAEGNPIGSPMTDDNGNQFIGPTFLNHDRIDCYDRLASAAEKKALEAENLAKAISQLMQQCSCKQYGSCQGNQQQQQACNNQKNPSSQANCSPYNGSCKLPVGFQNTNVGSEPDNSLACCPDNIKLQIKGYLNQHGDGKSNKQVTPFLLPFTEECPGDGSCTDNILQKYYGLDEFYNNQDNITQLIQKQATVNKQTVSYIDLGNCNICNNSCTCSPGDTACLKNQGTCQQNQQKCLVQREQCLQDPTKSAWGKLDLAQQIQYLQEQMQQIQNNIQQDQQTVTRASQTIQSCPTVKSYIDFTHIDETTNTQTTLLNVVKPFNSSVTGTNDASMNNYCNGFSYDNSEGFQNCSNMCPVTQNSLSCYASCNKTVQTCDPTKMTAAQLQACNLANQQANAACTSKCYNGQACNSGSPFKTFGSCIAGYSNTCQSTCSLEYLSCSSQYQNCMSLCQNNSQCLQNNLQQCIISPSALNNCQQLTQQNASATQISQCISQSYLCPAGSDQNAGYADCVKNPASATAATYSSSYLYQNPTTQLCQFPYTTIGYANKAGNPVQCIQANPQTAKCPASSQCPNCPCNTLNTTFTFSLEQKVNPQEINFCNTQSAATTPVTGTALNTGSISALGSSYGYGGSGSTSNTCTTTTQSINQFRMVGPTCTQPAFNGDPLTFYCQQDFWNDPTNDNNRTSNLGVASDLTQTLVCSPNGEIPVGMVTDDSVTWATNMLNTLKPITDSVQSMLSFFSKISTAQEYCACDSTYDDGQPICQTCCNFTKGQGGPNTCSPTACTGNSCQQMINSLQQIINYHTDIKSNFDTLFTEVSKETRSDVLKELTYARNQTTQCSDQQQDAGQNNTRMISCQQALNNIIYPITDPRSSIYINQQQLYHYCYGAAAGKLVSDTSVQTDNWFCCNSTNEAAPAVPQPLPDMPSADYSGAMY